MMIQRIGWVVGASMLLSAAAHAEIASDPGTQQATTIADRADVASSTRRVSGLVRLGYDGGGEDLVSGRDADGEHFSLTAGGGATIAAGVSFTPAPYLALDVTVGYKRTAASIGDGNISFSRIPVDVVISRVAEHQRLGIGLTAHFAPTLGCDFTGCREDLELDTAYGFLLQWIVNFNHVELGLRGTLLNYGVGNGSDEQLHGSSLGAFIGARI